MTRPAVPPMPPGDPRGTRHTTAVMLRARELVDGGWTPERARHLLAEEFSLDRPVSANTIRAWTYGYKQQRDQSKRLTGPAEMTPSLLLALRVEDKLTYTAIAAVAHRFFGEDMTEDECRHRLYELGAPKNPNKARATRQQNLLRRAA